MKRTPGWRRWMGTIKAQMVTIALLPSIAVVIAGAGLSGYLINGGGAWAFCFAATSVAAAMLVFSLRVLMVMTGRLRQLHAGTRELADHGLPEMLRQQRRGELDSVANVWRLDQSDDEIGQIAGSVNELRRIAIGSRREDLATQQGARHVFLALAHRSQVIAHHQLETLDQAEHAVEDPDHLQLLFRLDHLATRSRRYAESLVAVGGEQPGRQWRNPVPLPRIVHSAVAETQDYTRIGVGHLPEIAIPGSAVADLVHVLAELMDNAMSFSAPDARVEVRADTTTQGTALTIQDHGPGIAEKELAQINALLRDAPDFDLLTQSADPRVGLFVVAHLAARHGLQVTLQQSADGGTEATVIIPALLGAGTESEPQAAQGVEQASDRTTWVAAQSDASGSHGSILSIPWPHTGTASGRTPEQMREALTDFQRGTRRAQSASPEADS